uniref:Uncharacterized protein n=1 Tax=Rhodococcus sp. NS1 TaxID=402236 RepID=A0A097SPS3_9NOCA|nr:hypothetical protein LRS1606.82 [Rhodococcus sp. NS1]
MRFRRRRTEPPWTRRRLCSDDPWRRRHRTGNGRCGAASRPRGCSPRLTRDGAVGIGQRGASGVTHSRRTRRAWRPLGPTPTSNSTAWPSWKTGTLLHSMSVCSTNRSAPPSSGAMKPKPLSPLNHLIIPRATATTPFLDTPEVDA